MPFYGRRRFARKKFSSRKPIMSTGTRYLARKAYSVARFARSLARPKKLYLDNGAILDTVNNTGTLTLLSDIAQGNDVDGRTGNTVRARSLYFQCDVEGNAQHTSNAMRVVIFMDKENQGSSPPTSDIFQNVGNPNVIVSPLNVDHLSRYQILMDKRFVLRNQTNYTSGTAASSGVDRVLYKRYIKLWKYIRFTGPSSGDIYKNALYIFYASDVSSDDPLITWNCRLCYNDV